MGKSSTRLYSTSVTAWLLPNENVFLKILFVMCTLKKIYPIRQSLNISSNDYFFFVFWRKFISSDCWNLVFLQKIILCVFWGKFNSIRLKIIIVSSKRYFTCIYPNRLKISVSSKYHFLCVFWRRFIPSDCWNLVFPQKIISYVTSN